MLYKVLCRYQVKFSQVSRNSKMFGYNYDKLKKHISVLYFIKVF